MKAKDIIALIGFYIPVLCVQTAGALITQRSVHDWYPALAKSALTPPGFVFGIVWTSLYLCMTVAAWRIWRVQQRLLTSAQRVWCLQLLAGLLWSMVFFGMRMTHEGLAVIACVWIFVLLTFRRFLRIDRLAAVLIGPLLLWVSFAAYLNLVIVLRN